MAEPENTRVPAKYSPIPYTFRLPNDSTIYPGGKGLAKCPPFYVQLDHALAVVWSLFSEEETAKPLGVAQIQWALSFIKGIRNYKGDSPPDILVCIEVMEEALINQYADMADAMKPFKSPDTKEVSTIMESESKLLCEHIPFSVNYAEMLKYKLSPSERTLVPDNSEVKESLKTIPDLPAKDMQSREEVIEFLKKFRKEQICKVQEELKRLQCIESYIGITDSCSFKPCVTEHEIKDCNCKKK